MAAHRYWRVFNYRTRGDNGNFTGMSEMEWHATPGGPNIATGGTPLSSGAFQAGSAATAYDGLESTIFQWNSGTGRWIGYDFGAPVDIAEVAILPNKDAVTRSFGDFVVQYSDDNVTWVDDWYCSVIAYTLHVWHLFTRPAPSPTSRYWRVRPLTMTSGGTLSAAEVEMRSSVGGADQTGSGTPSARTTFGGNPVTLAFDNNPATIYSGVGGILPAEWICYDFGAGNDKNIAQISWTARPDGNEWQNPLTANVENSPNGVDWIPVWSFATTPWSSGVTRVFTDPAVATAARRRQQVVC